MKRQILLIALVMALGSAAYGQKLGKPTQTPVPATPEQRVAIQEGVKLHDAKKYAEAIAKYRSVLEKNPHSTMAMYELSLTLDAKGEELEAVETAYRGSKYVSDELPLFYVMIASSLDDHGKPKEAIAIYEDGLKLLVGDDRFRKYRASLHYNLGVTHMRQKNYPAARTSLKSAVENDFSYASPHYLLSNLFSGTRYAVPAMLAAARFISLEYNTDRSRAAAKTFVDGLKPAAKDPKTGNMTINLDFGAPTDEGEFGMIQIIAPTLLTIKDEKDKGKSENQMFAEGVDTIISILAEDKEAKTKFVGKTYIPFLAEMKRRGYVDVFSYIALYLSGKEDAMKWLEGNDAKLGAFIAWARDYEPAVK